MRVVAGIAKGHRLQAVPGDSTRPILDRVKTALFDTIRPELEDSSVLDLFAGSGSVGIEALSQGADHCTFIDCNHKAIETIQDNLAKTGLKQRATVQRSDAFTFLNQTSQAYDLIFIAPPQYQKLWSKALSAVDKHPLLIADNGSVIVQIDPKEYEEIELNNIIEMRQKRYGNTILVFYQRPTRKKSSLTN